MASCACAWWWLYVPAWWELRWTKPGRNRGWSSLWTGTYRVDSNWSKVQLNINSKALVAHIDRVVWRQPSDDLSYLATVNMVCRSQKYFWSPSSTSTWRLMKWRHHDVIDVEVHSWSWRWTPKKKLRPENEYARRFYDIWPLDRLYTTRSCWDTAV